MHRTDGWATASTETSNAGNCIRLPVTCIRAVLALPRKQPVSLFPAATIRGGFGSTLRGLVCANRGVQCRSCLLQRSCAYAYLFESSPPLDAVRLRRYHDIPRPFAMLPRQDGDRMTIDIVLFGNAASYVPYFIYTLNRLGARGLGASRMPYQVEKVLDANGNVVYPLNGDMVAQDIPAMVLMVCPGPSRIGSVDLRFFTPVTLRKNGRILRRFDCEAFFSTLLRRVTNLDAFYGTGRTGGIDPRPFLSAAGALSVVTDTKPVALHRISSRQHRRIELNGLEGTVRMKGDVGAVMPLLKAGLHTGVGKNTMFGFGFYEMTVDYTGQQT